MLPTPALAALASLAIAASASASIFVDFDSPSDLDDFVQRGSTVTPPTVTDYSWTGTTGVGSPDGAVTSGNAGSTSDQNLFYNAASFDPADGPLTISVFFEASAATASGVSRTFIGFANNNGINLSTENGKIGVRVFKNATADFTLQLVNNLSTTTLGSSFALTDGNWYRITATVTQTTPGNYTLEGELLDFGPDGTTLNNAFARSGSADVANGNLQTDTTWVVGLLNQDNNGGATAFDNLSAQVVPEPASLALLAAGCACLMHRRG